MKAHSNQLVCIGHRTSTIASAGRMLIDVRTGELLKPWASHACTLLPCLRKLSIFVSTRKTECRKGRHFLKWLWQIHSIANGALSSAHSRSQGVRGWEEHVVTMLGQMLPKAKNPIQKSSIWVWQRSWTMASYYLQHVSKWCRANFGPASSFSCSVCI